MPLNDREFKFVKEMAVRMSEPERRILNPSMRTETRKVIDSLVERGYCNLSRAVCMGRLTGETIIAVSEAGVDVILLSER